MTEKEILDPETERLIGALPQLAQALTGHTTIHILPLGEAVKRADAYDAAENALRSRIRQLIEEARQQEIAKRRLP